MEKGENTMYKKIGKLSCIFIITTVLVTMFVAATVVQADPTTTLTVIPQSIINPSLSPGSIMVINASVIDVVELFTWQVEIFFDPTLLNCTRAWYPSDHVFAGQPIVPVTPIINNVEGSIVHGASLMGTATPFTGNGTLCQIEFEVLDRGSCGLNFSEPYGADTFLLDADMTDIPADVIDGYFDNRLAVPEPPVAMFDYSPKPPLVDQWITFDATASYDPDGTIVSYEWTFGDGGADSGEIVTYKYTSLGTYQVNLTVTDNDNLTDTEIKEVTVYEVLPAKLYIDPPEIINATLLPPTIVTINVTVDDVIDMYDYEFKLSYNTEMLTCIGALINRVQNQTNFTPTIHINDGDGYIWINVTYYPPATPISTNTPLALVTIFFQIDTTGSSVLHLYDTELSDSSRQPMPHETEDGFIMTLIRDVAITHVAPSTNWAYQGWPVDITVTAKNFGNISESFDVKVYYNSNLLETYPIVDLPPATEITIVFTWNTSNLTPCNNYTITGEATTIPFEYNTANNVLVDGTVEIRLLGDINGDGKVDMRDVAIAAAAFGSYPGHPRWNPDADITGPLYLVPDGKVDTRDVAVITRNFGKTC